MTRNAIVEKVTGKQTLPCILTSDEKARFQQELLQTILRQESLVEQKKAATDQIGGRIKEAKTTVQRISVLLDSGHEYREVETETTRDWTDSGWITTVRLDTGETIERRPMVGVELQIPIRLRPQVASISETEPIEEGPPPDRRRRKKAPRPEAESTANVPNPQVAVTIVTEADGVDNTKDQEEEFDFEDDHDRNR